MTRLSGVRTARPIQGDDIAGLIEERGEAALLF
jgi:hypothetical protein